MQKIAGDSKKGWHEKLHWGACSALVLALCCASLGMMSLRQWHGLQRNERYLDISLISRSTADYSARRPVILAAQVGLGIIKDRIRDSHPDPAALPVRLAAVTAMLHFPIPGDGASKDLGNVRIDSTRPAVTGPVPTPPTTERSRPDNQEEPLPEKLGTPEKPTKSSKPDRPSRSTHPDRSDRQESRGKAKK